MVLFMNINVQLGEHLVISYHQVMRLTMLMFVGTDDVSQHSLLACCELRA